MKRPGHATPFEQPLIGRDEDLSVLSTYIVGVAAGTGATIVLIGDAGAGKTRLADAVAADAAQRGFRVAAGRAFRAESGVPYALFADALMPVVRGLDPAALASLTRGSIAELSLVLPGLGSAVRPQSDDPAELRGRLLWKVAEFVHALAARQPLVLLLDDVHWADIASLELLHFLARQTTQSRVLILCTYNETERGRRPELHELEQSLLALGIAHIHTVRALTRSETGELVRRTFDADHRLTGDFATLLFGWTRGNVFFIREILRSLTDAGRLYRDDDGQWHGWDSAELQLPASVRDTIVARLTHISDDARAVADTAAAIGSRFHHDLLRAVVHVPDDRLLSAIDELRSTSFIVESVGADDIRYDFTHPLLREVLYAELGTARRRALHATIAEALEQHYGTDADAHADELAIHFVSAEAGSLAPRAVRYLHAAGVAALDRFADREAVGYLKLASQLWTPAATVPREQALFQLARAHQRRGDYDTAIELLQELLPQHVSADTAHAAAALRRRLGQACFWSGDGAGALTHYRAGMELTAGSDTAIEAALRLAAGVCLQELGRAEEAKLHIDTARDIAERVGDTTLLARAHRALLLLHSWTGPPDEARRQGARAAALARDAGDTSTEFFSEWGLAVLEGLTGHTDAMAAHVAVIEEIADRRQSPLLRLWTAELSIELDAARGNWDRGIATGEHAVRLARSLNQRTLLPRLLVWTALIHLGRGKDIELAKSYIDEAWSISGAAGSVSGPVDVHSVVPAHIGLAAYHIVTRDFAEAIRICERGLAVADRSGYTFWAMHRLLPLLAEAHCHLWDVDGALAVEERIRRESQRLGHKVGLAWADTCRALSVWLRGDPAGATRLMRAACEALESIPMLGDAARLRRQLAGRLAETGDREGALLELRKVHEMFVRMGAEHELNKARGMFKEIGAKPPARSTAEGADGLTGRELEIAQLVGLRRSTKAIAREFDISPRTVSTHLTNMYRKLGLASRGELADWIRKHNPD